MKDIFKEYESALQWVFTDHKVNDMEIKWRIHEAMKKVKRQLNWSDERLFNFIMAQFKASNKHLFHNKDKHKHVTIMLNHAKKSLDGLLKRL